MYLKVRIIFSFFFQSRPQNDESRSPEYYVGCNCFDQKVAYQFFLAHSRISEMTVDQNICFF